jgi:hypothetical protein
MGGPGAAVNLDAVTRLRRVVLSIAVVAALWAALAALTGGGAIQLGAIRISSRNPRNPLLAALLAAALAWAIAPGGGRTTAIVSDARWMFTPMLEYLRRLAAAWMRADAVVQRRSSRSRSRRSGFARAPWSPPDRTRRVT